MSSSEITASRPESATNELITVAAASMLLDLSTSEVRDLVDAGVLTHATWDGVWLLWAHEVDALAVA